MGRFDKIHKNFGYRKIAVCFLGILCALLMACAPSAPEFQQEPERTEPPAPTSTPVLENPVAFYWGGYRTAFEQALERMNAAAGTQMEYLTNVLSVCSYMQHMQSVLQPLMALSYTSEGLWDGPLVGAVSGTGSITGNYEQASFTCTLFNGGRIAGTLEENSLQGAYEMYYETQEPILNEEGDVRGYYGEYRPLCSVELREETAGWYALVNRQGAYSAMYILADKVYFAEDMAEAVSPSASPEDWADWRLEAGAFHIIIHEELEGDFVENAV